MPRFDVGRTTGRWPSILAALGVDEKTLSKRNVPCPFCCGKDRFRFTDFDGLGMWICNNCGTGNGMQFVERYEGVDFVGAIKAVESVLPGAYVQEVAKRAPPSVRLNKLWSRASKLEWDDPVDKYLTARGIDCPVGSSALRCARGVAYFDNKVEIGRYDAMLALVRDSRGSPATIHCTYLDRARKAPVPSPKKVLSAMGAGGHIRIDPAGKTLAVAEGIETALRVREETRYPVWSTISAGGMKSLEIPGDVRQLIIYADNDTNFVGQESAYALARRVQSDELSVRVYVARLPGYDFADDVSWE